MGIKFDGKMYHLHQRTKNKREAQRIAKRLRKKSSKCARVIYSGEGKKRYWYIYVRQ